MELLPQEGQHKRLLQISHSLIGEIPEDGGYLGPIPLGSGSITLGDFSQEVFDLYPHWDQLDFSEERPIYFAYAGEWFLNQKKYDKSARLLLASYILETENHRPPNEGSHNLLGFYLDRPENTLLRATMESLSLRSPLHKTEEAFQKLKEFLKSIPSFSVPTKLHTPS